MIQNITITQCIVSEKSKEGKPYGLTRGGKFIPAKRIAIKIEGDDNWYSDFLMPGDIRETWTPGVKATISTYEKNGYKNFRLPSQIDYLEDRVSKLEIEVSQLKGQSAGHYDEPTATGDIDPADLPF